MTDEIAAFIRAQLKADEADALVATPGPWRHDPVKHWREPGSVRFEESVFAGPEGADATSVALTGPSDDPQSMRDASHIARHGPARVLREVAAKKAFLGLHHFGSTPDGFRYCKTCGSGEPDTYPTEWPCPTIRHLAAVYADRDGYKESWAP